MCLHSHNPRLAVALVYASYCVFFYISAVPPKCSSSIVQDHEQEDILVEISCIAEYRGCMAARIIWKDGDDKILFETEPHHDYEMTPHFRVIRGDTILRARPPFPYRCEVLFKVDDDHAGKFPQFKNFGNESASVICHPAQNDALAKKSSPLQMNYLVERRCLLVVVCV